MADDLETKLVNYYEEWEDNTQSSRADSERNRDYYDNYQYTEEEKNILKARNQPIVTFNLIKRTVDALLGVEKENRTDPKALPRTPQHAEDAESITDSIRYVLDNNDFDQEASAGFKHLLVEGVEGYDIQIIPKQRDFEIGVNSIPWDRMFWDPHSRRNDFKDAKFKGIVIWMDWEDAKNKKEWDQDVLKTAIEKQETPHNTTHADKPIFKWNDHQRKRVKICYINYKENNRWHYAYFCKGGILQGGEPIPYVDEFGIQQASLEFQSAFVDRDGNRYAYTTALVSPQDEVNKRRSKTLDAVTRRQTFGNQRAGIDVEKAKAEAGKADGHFDLQAGEWGKDFGIVPNPEISTGNLQLLIEAKDAFNVVGANTSVTGKEDRVMSGRAEIVRQQAGFRELAPVTDAHSSVKKRIYRKIWYLVRQYWDGERWIRVTDDEDNLKWVGLNQPITLRDQIEEDFADDPGALLTLQQMEGDPRLNQVVGVRNELSQMDVDITIEEAPDIANIQQEQFEIIVDLFRAFPGDISPEAIVELSSLRTKQKEKFIERMRGGEEGQQQLLAQQQEKSQLDRVQQIAEIEKIQSETEENQAAALEKVSKAMEDRFTA